MLLYGFVNTFVVTDWIMYYHKIQHQTSTRTQSLTHSDVMKTTTGLRAVP